MEQRWHDVLFAHWAVDADVLRPLVPPQLTLERLDGRAWVGLVPFLMSGIRVRGLPPLPRLSRFPEVNLRTYVQCAGSRGVYFLSLDGDSRLGAAVARRWFHVLYHRARIGFSKQGDTVHFRSSRIQSSVPPARLLASYAPVAEPATPEPDSLEHWLVERYRLFAVDRRGAVVCGEVQHPPWQLCRARLQVQENTIGAALGLDLDSEPHHLAYGRIQRARFWWPGRVGGPHRRPNETDGRQESARSPSPPAPSAG